MTIKEDYYKVLNIPKSATEIEIKRAYKRLAMKHHPDRNKNSKISEKKFKKIKEAYEILINPKKRSAYDQYGHSAFDQNSSGDDFQESFTQSSDFGDIFGDVFGDIFGNNQSNSYQGADLQYNIVLNLEEAVKGCTKKIYIPTWKICSLCKGSKIQPGTQKENCRTCNGNGNIHMRKGFFTVQQTCPSCNGQGSYIKNPCNNCNGNGKIKKSKKLSIKIPSGINDNDKIKLNNEGEERKNGAASGDLYIKINIKKHHIFKRKENDLYCEVPICFTVAALGGNVEVPTLNGRLKLKIPPETQSGKIFKIRGKGVKSIRNRFTGDLLCKIIIETPVNLNNSQKKLLQKFKNSIQGYQKKKNNPRSTRFFDSVKKFFDNLTM